MPVYSFTVEYEGGTFCSQFEAKNLGEAITAYNEADPSEQGAVPISDPVPLEGLTNFWYASNHYSDDRTITANIVKTDMS